MDGSMDGWMDGWMDGRSGLASGSVIARSAGRVGSGQAAVTSPRARCPLSVRRAPLARGPLRSALLCSLARRTMVAHFSLLPSCCGVSLKNGALWLAEMCTMVGVVLVIFSAFAIDEVLYHWHVSSGHFVATIHSIALVLGLGQTVTSILMGYGAYKEIPQLLLPWIIFFSVQTCLLFLLMITFAVWCIIYIEPIPLGITIFIVTTAYCHAFRYFILAVYSFYRQLRVCSTDSSSHVIQLA